MHVNDQSYKSFGTWIQDYAHVAGGRYQSVDDLPQDNWYPTQHVLRMKDVSEEWDVLSTVQLFVHARDNTKDSWQEIPVAFTQGLVTPRRMVNGSLFLLTRPEHEERPSNAEAATLAPGRYLIKAYVDSGQRLNDDPGAFLGPEEYFGALEIDALWRDGFPNAELADGSRLKK